MSNHILATHLDPLHKLKSGFVTPDAIEISQWTTATLPLAGVETGGHELFVLYDPAKADKEYFVVEYRYGAGSTYDAPLGNHVVLWHIIEDAETRATYPFPTDNPGCRIPIRYLGLLSQDGESKDLVWADGTPAHIRVTRQSTVGALTNVEVAKLP